MPRDTHTDTVPNLRMTAKTWTWLIALSVLWGGTFFLAEIALQDLPPLTLVLMRVSLAALALWAYVGLSGRRIPRSGPVWRAGFGMAMLNNVIPFTLIFWGQTQIASGLASILNATTPIFTVVVAHVLLADERATPSKWLGVGLGLIGVAVIMGPDAFLGESLVLGKLAILGAALSYGFAGAYGRRFISLGVDPVVTADLQVTASTAILLPVVCIVDTPWALATPASGTWMAVITLALLSTALAYVLFFRILAVAGATNLMLVTLLIPVTALSLGIGVLGESLLLQHIFGTALISGALVVLDGRLTKRLRQGAQG